MKDDKTKLIQVCNLSKHFPVKKGLFNKVVGQVQAVNDLNFDIFKGETLGLVGESGCGKSTTGRCILRLLNPTAGQILFNGKNIANIGSGELKKFRNQMQIIFQNPYSSLDPRMTVKQIVTEPLVIHKVCNGSDLADRFYELLDMVGISKVSEDRYPHEFSGGQRQRIGIARALALKPTFIVADEPVSALDVSVQAQILNLLQDLRNELDLTYLFISHNLNVVQYVSDRVAVMYLGSIMELASADLLYSNPMHPYTEALLSAIPVPDPTFKRDNRILIDGDVPSPENPPAGCKFHTRCIYVDDICKQVEPELRSLAPEHFVRCHFAEKLNLKGY